MEAYPRSDRTKHFEQRRDRFFDLYEARGAMNRESYRQHVLLAIDAVRESRLRRIADGYGALALGARVEDIADCG